MPNHENTKNKNKCFFSNDDKPWKIPPKTNTFSIDVKPWKAQNQTKFSIVATPWKRQQRKTKMHILCSKTIQPMVFPLTRHLYNHKKKGKTEIILEIRIIKRRKTHDFSKQTTYQIMNFIKKKSKWCHCK